MNVICGDCDERFDDAERSCICPHPLIMPQEDLDRKIAALTLIGKTVAFAHDLSKPYRVQSVSWNGMVTVEGFSGEFAPHLFAVIE